MLLHEFFLIGLLFHYCVINPTLRILFQIPLQEKLNIWLSDYYISVEVMIMSLEKQMSCTVRSVQ